jgi:hypothetical protein
VVLTAVAAASALGCLWKNSIVCTASYTSMCVLGAGVLRSLAADGAAAAVGTARAVTLTAMSICNSKLIRSTHYT